MTSSGDAASQCLLKAQVAASWLPIHVVQPKSLEIEAAATELESLFGGVPHEPTPAPNILEEAEQRLIAGDGDLTQSQLENKHLRALPYLLWTSDHGWSERPRLIKDYLRWAEDWRTAPRRLWRHYLLHMRPESLATKELARWLDQRQEKLTPSLRDFSNHWDLFQPERAVGKIARSLLAGSHLIDELTELKVDRTSFLKSALLLSVFKALGKRLREYSESSKVAHTLKQLLLSLGENPLHKMEGPGGLGQAAQKALVEGLVMWAERQGKMEIDQTLDLLHLIIGDPRLYEPRWIEIDPVIRQTVELWLTEQTLKTFFQVFKSQNAVNPHMVAERESFWRRYMENKKISRAWLITGKNGLATAKKLLEKSFGRFIGGNPVHLGLMVQIGSYVILERNQNGGTLFWPTGDSAMPSFYGSDYDLQELIPMCKHNTQDRYFLTHNPPNWQQKYRSKIHQLTGVNLTF